MPALLSFSVQVGTVLKVRVTAVVESDLSPYWPSLLRPFYSSLKYALPFTGELKRNENILYEKQR